MRYKTLLFDADGTLLDFAQAECEALSDMFSLLGQPFSDKIARRYSEINDSLWKALERGEIERAALSQKRFEILGKEYSLECDPGEMSEIYFSALAEKSHLIPGSYEVCRELGESCRLYIITNGFKKIQEKRFGTSPLAPLFEGVFISEAIGADKPAREFFDAVASAIPGYNRAEILVIGDSLSSDIAGGLGAGLDVCWYNPAGARPPEGVKINYIITELAELIGIAAGHFEK